MTSRQTLLSIITSICLLSGLGFARANEVPHAPGGPEIAERCKENPERCEKMKARMQEWCANHADRCEEMKKHREEMRQQCEKDPVACKQKREEMGKKMHQRMEEKCKKNPEKCKEWKERHGHGEMPCDHHGAPDSNPH